MRWCRKIWSSQRGHRLYVGCALHAGQLRLHARKQNLAHLHSHPHTCTHTHSLIDATDGCVISTLPVLFISMFIFSPVTIYSTADAYVFFSSDVTSVDITFSPSFVTIADAVPDCTRNNGPSAFSCVPTKINKTHQSLFRAKEHKSFTWKCLFVDSYFQVLSACV